MPVSERGFDLVFSVGFLVMLSAVISPNPFCLEYRLGDCVFWCENESTVRGLVLTIIRRILFVTWVDGRSNYRIEN
jgi:hypothetical protein